RCTLAARSTAPGDEDDTIAVRLLGIVDVHQQSEPGIHPYKTFDSMRAAGWPFWPKSKGSAQIRAAILVMRRFLPRQPSRFGSLPQRSSCNPTDAAEFFRNLIQLIFRARPGSSVGRAQP